ncbi:hypothetical protein KAS31_03620 [Candidatus Parcubacteria bacterium]|nr:hypothetical protein [Candidatus Parcubacteria bacterium]
MAIESERHVEDDVNELFNFVRSNFKGSELSKIKRALSYWDDKDVDYALDCFKLISRNSKDGSDEKIIARMGMVACSTKQGKTERALSSLGMISGMLRENFFLGSCYCFDKLKEKDISSEDVIVAMEIFKKTIVIAEKFQIKSQKAGEDENRRVTEVIRISSRINLAKLQIFQEKWKESIQNLLQIEALANLRNEYIILLEIYRLIMRAYYNLDGENSDSVQKYQKKHLAIQNIVAKER